MTRVAGGRTVLDSEMVSQIIAATHRGRGVTRPGKVTLE
jgi:hypothetical protein